MKNRVKYLILLLAVIPLGFGIISFSRYIIKENNVNYLKSKKFFFNSNMLSTSNNYLSNWNGEGEYTIPIDLLNYKDNLRWTEYDIPYTMEVTCTTPKGTLNCSASDGTIVYDSNTKTKNIVNVLVNNDNNIIFDNNDEVAVTIKAISTSPYRKELSNTITLVIKNNSIDYQIVDSTNQKYLVLILNNNSNTEENVNLSWDNTKFSPDATNDVFNDFTSSEEISNVTYYNKLKFTISANSQKEIIFYKTDATIDYTNTNYIVIS